jgi:hypothetical protein
MTARQRRAVGVLGTLIIVAASLNLTILALLTWTDQINGKRGLGRFFLLAVSNGDALSTALKIIPIIASLAAAWVSRRVQSNLVYYLLVAISVLGIVAGAAMLFAISDADLAKAFWIYSNVSGIDSPESFDGPARISLIGMVGWFSGVLGIQLGVGGNDQSS